MSEPLRATLPLLFEVGCEEIPARFLRDAEKGLGERVQAGLTEARLAPGAHASHVPEAGALRETFLQTYSTPRRLVVYVPALLAHQPDKIEEILGPPVKVAVDKEGKYTRAAESFVQKNSARLEELTRTTTPKGEYLALRKTIQGRSAQAMLPEILPAAVLGLSFPKSMYWTHKSAPRFVRPIRWLLAILGEGKQSVTVEFELLGVKSGNFTFGHRARNLNPQSVESFKDYVKKLEQSHVEIDPAKRQVHIAQEIKVLLKELSINIVEDSELEDWIVNSTEWPRPLLGSFDERFLHLPREILITVMRDHQRYFAVEDGQGNLMPRFLAVLNMDSDARGLIRKGHERVLRARFRDAEFFWKADQRVPLRDRFPLLDKVTYRAELGSYLEKIRRMKVLAEHLASDLDALSVLKVGQREHVLRAVELCKCDLTTQMVREFTELQGIVGGLYARAEGEVEEVATAIYDHYLPLGAEGKSPRSIAGALVSLVDKLDSVVTEFALGHEPTGSSDPFALRRQAQGIIKVIVDYSIPISINNMLVFATINIGELWRGGLDSITKFMEERVRFYLETAGPCRYDTVRAVMAAGWDRPAEAFQRARALERIRDTEDFVALAVAAKRTRNILKKSASQEEYQSGRLDPSLLREELEVELYRAYQAVFAEVSEEGVAARDYEAMLTATARLRPAIDKFFDRVLVMHPDPTLRRNRLLLLGLLEKKVFSLVADLSEIEAHVDASTSSKNEPKS